MGKRAESEGLAYSMLHFYEYKTLVGYNCYEMAQDVDMLCATTKDPERSCSWESYFRTAITYVLAYCWSIELIYLCRKDSVYGKTFIYLVSLHHACFCVTAVTTSQASSYQ